MSSRRGVFLLFAVLAAACDGERSVTDRELRDELRSLRQELAPRPIDENALDRALRPLQRDLDRLTEEQRAARRELDALRFELGRGGRGESSRPPLPSVGDAAAGPAPAERSPAIDAAVAQRIAEFERQLAAAQQREAALETAVARSLAATTDRVDSILQQLVALAGERRIESPLPTPANGDAANPPHGREAVPPAPVDASPTAPVTEPVAAATPADELAGELAAKAGERESAFHRSRAQSQQGWLIGVLSLGLVAVAVLAWRLRQSAPARRAEPDAAAAPRGDLTTDELWAAAGLLSEAVGRLRSAVPVAATAPAPMAAAEAVAAPSAAPEPTSPLDGEPAAVAATAEPPNEPAAIESTAADLVHDDEVFVIDDDRGFLASVDWSSVGTPLAAAAPAAAAPAPAPPAAGSANAPPRLTLQISVRDHVLARAALDAYLRQDPRVLRAPAPVLRSHEAGIAVEVSLLPGLLPGEHEHLRSVLQQLVGRD